LDLKSLEIKEEEKNTAIFAELAKLNLTKPKHVTLPNPPS